MSLTRMFPTPSDRMSIMWTLMPIEDAVVLEYGPAGTTHFGNGLYASLGIQTENAIFTTHISEDDVVMGDVSRLEAAIWEVDEAYHPRVIFVVGSAAAAVIGTDIKGVCSYMQEEVRARLVAFDDGGFRGDYSFGLKAAYDLMARELVEPGGEKEADSYLILGASLGEYRCRSDIWEVQNLMQEAFGMRCRAVFGMESSIEDLEQAGRGVLSLVLRPEAISAAQLLEEKAELPFLFGAPYGYEGTLKWLEEIGTLVGRPVSPALADRLKKKMRRNGFSMGGPMGSVRLKEPRAVIQGDYTRLLGLRAALEEMHIPTETLLCSHSLKNMPPSEHELLYLPREKERIEYLSSLHECWLLGSLEMEQLCPEDNYFTCVSAPFYGHTQIASHLPYMGEKGMDCLMELSDAYFDKVGI